MWEKVVVTGARVVDIVANGSEQQGERVERLERAARAAGLTAIAVTWGYNPSDVLRDAGAQRIVGDVSAIAPLLDRLTLGMTAGIDL